MKKSTWFLLYAAGLSLPAYAYLRWVNDYQIDIEGALWIPVGWLMYLLISSAGIAVGWEIFADWREKRERRAYQHASRHVWYDIET